MKTIWNNYKFILEVALTFIGIVTLIFIMIKIISVIYRFMF